MDVICKPCTTDDEFAKLSLFFLERKYDLHPSFSTLEMVELLYAYMTQGQIYQVALPDGRIIAAAAYYLGTPEREFVDSHVALIDIVMLDRKYRGSIVFLSGLERLLGWIRRQHPEVTEVRFVALSENEYLCRLYAKFAPLAYRQEGHKGQESVFSDKISRMIDTLKRFRRV